MTPERIKTSRESCGLTQSALAKILGITRASVNAWEMGISMPSTHYIVELAGIFNVSTDYLLCVDSTATVSVDGLNEEEVRIVQLLVKHFKK